MNLTEEQTNLVREHMHLSILIDIMKEALNSLTDSKLYLKGLHQNMTRECGKYLSGRLGDVKETLRKDGLWTWHQVDGDMVNVTVAQRGAKEHFKLKLDIVQENNDKMFNELMDMVERQPSKPLDFSRTFPD